MPTPAIDCKPKSTPERKPLSMPKHQQVSADMADPTTTPTSTYPIDLDVEYPERPWYRSTTFFRVFTVIPIGIILSLLTSSGETSGTVVVTGTGYVMIPTFLMLLFRQKYPRWWFDWNRALTGFSFRVGSYLALLRDEYPATDDDQAIHVTMGYPDASTELNRWPPTRQVVPCYSALHRAVLPGDRSFLLCHSRVVCDPVYRALSEGLIRFCPWRRTLVDSACLRTRFCW